MNDHKTEFTIDTGADVTVISEQLCKQIGCPHQASSYTLCSPDHQTLPVVRKDIVTLTVETTTTWKTSNCDPIFEKALFSHVSKTREMSD